MLLINCPCVYFIRGRKMKKYFVLVILILSVLYSCNKSGNGKPRGIVTHNGLYVRDVPSTEFGRTLFQLKKGQKISILARSIQKIKVGRYYNYWYKIKLVNGKTGWCYAAFIKAKSNGKTMRKIDIDELLKPYQTKYSGKALCKAIRRNNFALVKELAENGADINARCIGRYTTYPIIAAAGKGTVQMVKYLVDKGADLSVTNSTEHRINALDAANICGHYNVVLFLVAKGMKINERNLLIASKKGYLKLVKYYVSKGLNVNFKSRWGTTPLSLAASNGHFNVVKFLVSKGADVHARDNNGKSILSYALETKNPRIINFLKSKGAIQ